MITVPAVYTVLAFVGIHYPSTIFLTQNVTRIGLFISPIFWTRYESGITELLYLYNPVSNYIEIVRVAVIDQRVPWTQFGVCLIQTSSLWVLAFYLIGKFGNKIRLVA